MEIERFWTETDVHPFDEVEWERRTAQITSEKGEVIFEQQDVEFPTFWSQLATNVVVSKYFRGHLGDPAREHSVRQLIGRVSRTISGWGREGNYFATEAHAAAFEDELTYLLLHQYVSFNSPVWFNVGLKDVPRPQCSACFINSVDDDMESIMRLAATEARLFKGGSGTGSNLSRLRSSCEPLAGGGVASGPVSFMRGFDAFAGVIKSGGKTRRAAKMVILDVDHPDILEFIRCKAEEEKKAWALIEAGYDGGFNVAGGAYDSIFFQNANHSVRATDAFMEAVAQDGEWATRFRRTGEPADTYRAWSILHEIAVATYICGDPGMQFDDTINRWHTCANTDRIYASNPCSEYMFLDDTACNLASLNLMKFRREDGSFDVEAYIHACEITITAQEIIVDNASYPTEAITRNSHDYRPLGLGYANLGALLMSLGLPYDSDAGRALAGALTAIMTGAAYQQSARIAGHLGPFAGYERNREPMLRVMGMHADAVDHIDASLVPEEIIGAAHQVWDECLQLGERCGYRNAQATVLAPTGTIAFMMDCDTTGIEPDIALVKYKSLVGGGLMKIVNQTVPLALRQLGYSEKEIDAICRYVDAHGTIEGAPGLLDRHLPVFDCAFRPDPRSGGTRSIPYMGHVHMMAAVQPFLSGAISKTVNVPEDITVEEIEQVYLQAWKLGLKAIAIYRDGSKRSQPLSTGKQEARGEKRETAAERPYRRKLPDERQSITHKFSVGGYEGYVTVGLYDDRTPGEIFITMSKEGSTISGLMDSFATCVSMALQYGVPLQVLCNKFSHTRFEPSGWTGNKDIPYARSIMDYIFRWLALKFLPREEHPEPEKSLTNGTSVPDLLEPETPSQKSEIPWTDALEQDAPPCSECGALMVRSGACYRCLNCGATSGCG
ncbi:MAG: vitamin B12-dependent ribonucleotide reductase [Armatimonadetes bacterium]|nr:vitamin B12-dependent ribonucleotide reductase [Armatimonadota bacterium]